jgi:hypothetical protein
MGRTYLFECEKCGYRAKVAGGAAEGAELTVQTILCYQCRELIDAVVSVKVPWPPAVGDTTIAAKFKGKTKAVAPPFAAVVDRLPLLGRVRTRWHRFKPACPIAPTHRIREWNLPDKCPRCGVFLERGATPLKQWE